MLEASFADTLEHCTEGVDEPPPRHQADMGRSTATSTDNQGVPQSRPTTAFTVHLDNGKRGRKPPSANKNRKASAESARKRKQAPLVDYTLEENQLMAEIVREARLNDLRERSVHTDIKLFDAHRRRQVREWRKEQMKQQAAETTVVDAAERRRLVNQMAEDMRRQASATGRNCRGPDTPRVYTSDN